MAKSVQQAPAIQVTDLTKYYGPVKAIEHLSFSIDYGEVVGFIGPNGAGKSTTIRTLAGLTLADAGMVELCGVPVAVQTKLAQQHLGYMPENNPLPEDMRVDEYLSHRAILKRIPRNQIAQRLDYVLQVCDLAKKAKRRIIGRLSKGFRQRVGIADAILNEPDVVIMDEPTIGLDPHQVISMRKLIDSLRGKMAFMISSHILPEIEACCDRVIIINHGRIVAMGTPQDLRREFLPAALFSITIKCPRQPFQMALADEFRQLHIVGHKALSDGFYRYRLESADHDVPPARLGTWIARHPEWSFAELRQLSPTLEDIFIAATQRSWEKTTHFRPSS